jgi:hypothetical protein
MALVPVAVTAKSGSLGELHASLIGSDGFLQKEHPLAEVNRRACLGALSSAALPMLAASLVPQVGHAGWFGRPSTAQPDAFDEALAYAGAIHPALSQQYTGRCPDGAQFRLRVATPIDPPRVVPVVLFAGASQRSVASYDPLMIALAGRGYMVIMPEFTHRTDESQVDSRWRRVAELRYACDQIFAVRATLGASAERMEPNLIAAWGHGDGCCTAMRLVGFDHQYRPDSTFADGRFRASVALEPEGGYPIGNIGQIGQAAERSSGSGLIIGAPENLIAPPRGTGLYGLAVGSYQTLASQPLAQNPRAMTSMAATLLFFDWQLREDNKAGEALHSLNQRVVTGLDAPLTLVRA